MNKAILFAAALSMTPLPAMSQQAQQSQDQSQDRQPTHSERDRDSRRGDLLDRLSRSDLRDRLSTAVQRLEGACGEDIEQFCGDVTPGGGRIASCMDAYSDQLSRSCSFALSRAADRIQQAVEHFADTCMSAVQQQCGNADNVRECLQQKNASLPHSCQTIIGAVQQGRQALAARLQGQGEQSQAQTGQEQGGPQQSAQAQGDQGLGRLKGLPAFSSDGKDLGQIVKVERAADGKIQSVQLQVGRLLGLGEKTVTIDGNKIEQLADRVRVMMNSDQIRTLPDTKGQGGSAQR
jgi:hypothetical protein